MNHSNSNISKKLKIAALLGMLAVILGAFGSHGLKPRLAINSYSAFQTGIQYHFYHTLVLLILTFFTSTTKNKWLDKSYYFLVTGIVLFSGSLYLLAIKDVTELSFLRFAGPITPIGGLFLIIGWAMLIKAALTLNEFQH